MASSVTHRRGAKRGPHTHRHQSLPRTLKPVLARLTRRPFDSASHIFELKWNGMRALAFVEGGRVRLQARNLRDITASFPEIHGLPKSVGADRTVLDGDRVCFDRDGTPSLARLQKRLQRQARGSLDRTPRAHFVAFDLLYRDGRPVIREPVTAAPAPARGKVVDLMAALRDSIASATREADARLEHEPAQEPEAEPAEAADGVRSRSRKTATRAG